MTSKKKIFHIIQSLGNGGWENALLRTLPLLSDFEHKIITLKELGELTSKFVASGIPVETVHCNGIIDIPGVLRLRKLARTERPDIILTYLFHADAIGRLALQNITSAPVIPFLGTTYNYSRYFFIRIFERLSKSFVFHYLANSEVVKETYVKKFKISPKKITTISTGIDTDFFDLVKPDPELLKTLSINSDDFVIICVANLHLNKGHQYLLKAFEQLHHTNTKKPLKLLLVGDGTEKESLKKQIENYNSKSNILFLGRRTDVPKLLKISHLFILPTLFEGMSNAILEAMACSLPVITTNIPENCVLIEDKKTGFLILPKSSSEIARVIREILNNQNETKKIGIAAMEFIHKNFSIKTSAESLRKFLNSL